MFGEALRKGKERALGVRTSVARKSRDCSSMLVNGCATADLASCNNTTPNHVSVLGNGGNSLRSQWMVLRQC
jgi:hypothetical protein